MQKEGIKYSKLVLSFSGQTDVKNNFRFFLDAVKIRFWNGCCGRNMILRE